MLLGVTETSLLKTAYLTIHKKLLLLNFHGGCQIRGMRNITLLFYDITINHDNDLFYVFHHTACCSTL